MSAKIALPLRLTFVAVGAGEGEGGPDRLLILVGGGGRDGFCRYFFGGDRSRSSSGRLGSGLGLHGGGSAETIRLDFVVEVFLDMIIELIVGPVVEGTVVLGADIAA